MTPGPRLGHPNSDPTTVVGLASVVGALLLVTACANKVPVPSIGDIADGQILSAPERTAADALQASVGQQARTVPAPNRRVAMPRAGEKTAYGVAVTSALEQAFKAFIGGDGDGALASLKEFEDAARDDSRARFQASHLRVQVLIAMGRAAEAIGEVNRAGDHERAVFRTDANSRSLRGEVRLWLDEYDGAEADFARVALATRLWRLPTSYAGPPKNMGELFNITTAQVRAFTGLAITALRRGDFTGALPWARHAEALLADVFAVADHGLYGMFVPSHADSYYGRALNLGVLGAARLVTEKDATAGDAQFSAAHAYLDAIDFASPKVTIEAFRSLALLAAGFSDRAADVAGEAAASATARGMADLVWRLQAVRGKALLADHRTAEGEVALRHAQAGLEAVSGALGSDHAKRRFGVGKEDVTRHLAQLDIDKGDFATLFADLERGRARAFVDMLAGRRLAVGREDAVSAEIRALDRRISAQRLIAASPNGATSDALNDLAGHLKARKSKIDALRRRDPELADAYAIAGRNLGDAQENLAPGEILAYAIPGDDEAPLRFLLVGRAETRFLTLDANQNDLLAALQAFNEAVGGGDPAAQKSAAATIGRIVAVAAWGATKSIYVVPTGHLYFVPWGALDISVPVAVLPTGGWLARSPAAIRTGNRASIVGDPEFFGAEAPLPAARQEAETIARQYDVAPLIGKAASEAALRASVGDGVELLHLATHAYFDADNPLHSGLLLSGDGEATVLTAAGLYENPLAAKVVVLSACETGVGEAVAGDDYLGFSRSFYLGGAATVINSLWPISEDGTLAFMTTFHAAAENGDYGAAWLKARDRLRADGFPPFVYGAFVLGGDLRG